jgi:signal transduction histidine kinase
VLLSSEPALCLAVQVRRQIYIIRTSGARLLALINDVMDAAALRQNKLVLKQEPVSEPGAAGVKEGAR